MILKYQRTSWTHLFKPAVKRTGCNQMVMLVRRWLTANVWLCNMFYLELARCPSTFPVSLISSVADQLKSGEILTICQFTYDLECSSINSINIILKFRCPNPEPDVGGEWLPYEYGIYVPLCSASC